MTAYSSSQANCFSFSSNQAALSSLQSISIGILQEKRFNLSEISLTEARMVLPTNWGNVGCQVSYNGFAACRQIHYGLAYGRKLSEAIAIGVQCNYYRTFLTGFIQRNSVNVEGGCLLRLSPSLNIGLHVNHPAKWMTASISTASLPYTYRFGIGYDVSKDFFIGMQWQKEENKPIQISAALHYRYTQSFFAKLGILGGNESIFAGWGLCYKSIRLDLLITRHRQLGYSPGISLFTQVASKKA